jgi:hypothetical protein
MNGQPEVADHRPITKSAGNHDPPQRSLNTEHGNNSPVGKRFDQRQPAAPQEPDEGRNDEETGDPAEEAMPPLVVEDPLVLGKAHTFVDKLVFRGLLILGEGIRPGRFTERRHNAGDDIPLHNGEAGARKADEPSDDDHQYDEAGDHQQPARDRVAIWSDGSRWRRHVLHSTR